MRSLFVATSSAHKLAEIQVGLGEEIGVRSLKDVQNPIHPIEDGATFADNAAIKAVAWAEYLAIRPDATVEFVLADDSGLEVDALGGLPGVHSARFAALDDGRSGNSPDAENNAKLIRLLREVPSDRRKGRFRCVLALTPVLPESAEELRRRTRFFSGECEGQMCLVPIGQSGFGYDPLFVPEGYTESFAELGSSVKDRISHRAKALRSLAEELRRA